MAIRKRIRRQLPKVILITTRVLVINILNKVSTKVIRSTAHRVQPARLAVPQLVKTVTRSIQVIVPLRLHGSVKGLVVVGVSGEDGEVVVCLVLDDRVEPAVADGHGFEADWLGSGESSLVLGLDVGVEDGAVVSAVALGCKVEGVARVLRKGSQETLKCFPEVGCSGGGGVGG